MARALTVFALALAFVNVSHSGRHHWHPVIFVNSVSR